MSNPFIPIETAKLNASYFSTENSLEEKRYVFIKGNRLIERWENLAAEDTFVIAETGFGLGLNFLLTWSLWLLHAPKTARLYYYSCENCPLTKIDLEHGIKLWPELQNYAKTLIEKYPVLTPGFHQLPFDEGRINLILMLGDPSACYKQLLVCGDVQLERQLRTNFVDAWFLDGFVKNPAMWSVDLLQTLALLSKPGTSLATYSAPLVKENLEAAGFMLQKINEFEPKCQRVVAEFKELITASRKLRTTPWHSSPHSPYKTKNALVLGAGLAGCYTAYALAKRGWKVTLLDEQSKVGLGASGNRQAILYPKLSAYRSPLTAFMLMAFMYACRVYNQFLTSAAIGELSGYLQLAFNEKERLSQESLAKWLHFYPELGQMVNAEEASNLAGIKLGTGGLFIAKSGWLDSQALCQLLKHTKNIAWSPNTSISELAYQDGLWHAGIHSAEVLVLANGYQATQFVQTNHLTLKPIRGQITLIATNSQSESLKIPLCGDGNILPVYQNLHSLGASYHLGNTEKGSDHSDDCENLSRLAKIPTDIKWSNEIKANWVGLRAATTDYLPLVGPVPDEKLFKSRFAGLATNTKRWIPVAGAYFPGLFLCAGFGSRGLTTIPLSAEYLASLINNEPAQIPQPIVQSLAPARFLIKEISRGV
ncbi:MAG: bifunctional tRNA (5-methylaminomethyl-2-thiouridine)(34)-methyltransferase MnmD/FAD-dependent 5-carboxymethylaminomethyl-2-thiouridine(34) oxidoreductase MnmC [Tatlockia sp.]|nr:bifunctional tRNA (5-methylaminomethyl-2-thiouridine)(34)-methyltransferase MnmD/FAD-dependent 5-carboxymethylaminomethyl-2-thiouridine(34) oxidoreductase MnmC [Tatlockia sp.]